MIASVGNLPPVAPVVPFEAIPEAEVAAGQNRLMLPPELGRRAMAVVLSVGAVFGVAQAAEAARDGRPAVVALGDERCTSDRPPVYNCPENGFDGTADEPTWLDPNYKLSAKEQKNGKSAGSVRGAPDPDGELRLPLGKGKEMVLKPDKNGGDPTLTVRAPGR